MDSACIWFVLSEMYGEMIKFHLTPLCDSEKWD